MPDVIPEEAPYYEIEYDACPMPGVGKFLHEHALPVKEPGVLLLDPLVIEPGIAKDQSPVGGRDGKVRMEEEHSKGI